MNEITLKKLSLMIIFLPVLFIISSCQKEESINPEEVSYYKSQENLEHSFSAVNSIAAAAIEYAEGEIAGRIAENSEFSCASVTFEGTADMGKIDIDYGDGCKGPDGKVRKGKIVVEYSGKRIFYGSAVYAVPANFYIDNCKIEGTLKSENISTNPEKPKFNVTIINGKYIKPDQTYTSWRSDRVHTWTYVGQNLEIAVTGTSYGRITGKEYSTEITEPLIYKLECIAQGNYVPVQGVKKITLHTQEEIVANYGSGECDEEITVTSNTHTAN